MLRDTIPSPRKGKYEIKIVPMSPGPAHREEFYWHLFYEGVKVNGGLSRTWDEAKRRAEHYKWEHHFSVWRGRHVWDEESSRWMLH